MKLELKHLDFVNNGKVKLSRLPHWEFKEVNLQDCILDFNPTDKEPFLRYKDVTFGLHQITPYKRLLSDLTKEIEVNRENIKPLILLNEQFRGMSKDLVPYLYGNETLELDITTENYSQTIDLFDGYLITQKLFEWHFDVFGLIEKGLAIDINTLNK